MCYRNRNVRVIWFSAITRSNRVDYAMVHRLFNKDSKYSIQTQDIVYVVVTTTLTVHKHTATEPRNRFL